jgi:hypothetical protein
MYPYLRRYLPGTDKIFSGYQPYQLVRNYQHCGENPILTGLLFLTGVYTMWGFVYTSEFTHSSCDWIPKEVNECIRVLLCLDLDSYLPDCNVSTVVGWLWSRFTLRGTHFTHVEFQVHRKCQMNYTGLCDHLYFIWTNPSFGLYLKAP